MRLSSQDLKRLSDAGRIPSQLAAALRQHPSSPHLAALGQLRNQPQRYQQQMEYFDQIIVLLWLERYRPDLYQLCYAIPNGGMRSGSVAGQMKASGQKSGYPDLGLDLARGRYHGLRLELKRSDGQGKQTPIQKQWQQQLQQAGYCYALCHGYAPCISAITAYADLACGHFDHQSTLDLDQLPAYPVVFDLQSQLFIGC